MKPQFYAERLYRFERYQLLLNRPVGTAVVVREYLEGELGLIRRFLDQYRFAYLYFKEKGCELDGIYFVRETRLPFSMQAFQLEADPGYSTGMDYLFSKFMALERLQGDLLSELAALEPTLGVGGAGVAGEGPVVRSTGKRFSWTGEVINLVELGYAVWLTGQLNEGKAGLQDIFRWLEESFGVEIGIPANRFREIRRRKRLSRTHFTEFCQSRLLEYMDEDDVYVPGGGKKKRISGF